MTTDELTVALLCVREHHVRAFKRQAKFSPFLKKIWPNKNSILLQNLSFPETADI